MAIDNKEIVLQFYKLFDEKSEDFVNIMTEDFVLYFGGFWGAPRPLSRSEFTGPFNNAFWASFTNMRHEFFEQVAQGDLVASRGTFTGTCTGAHGGTKGAELILDALTLHTVVGGKVTKEHMVIAPRANDQLPASGEPLASLFGMVTDLLSRDS